MDNSNRLANVSRRQNRRVWADIVAASLLALGLVLSTVALNQAGTENTQVSSMTIR